MKKTLIAALFVAAAPFAAHAEFTGSGSAANAAVSTAHQASQAADDVRVELEGHIIEQTRPEHYVFQDKSGKINIEIDQKHMPTANIDNKTLVRLYGEIDRDFGAVKVDVKRVEILR